MGLNANESSNANSYYQVKFQQSSFDPSLFYSFNFSTTQPTTQNISKEEMISFLISSKEVNSISSIKILRSDFNQIDITITLNSIPLLTNLSLIEIGNETPKTRTEYGEFKPSFLKSGKYLQIFNYFDSFCNLLCEQKYPFALNQDSISKNLPEIKDLQERVELSVGARMKNFDPLTNSLSPPYLWINLSTKKRSISNSLTIAGIIILSICGVLLLIAIISCCRIR